MTRFRTIKKSNWIICDKIDWWERRL